MSKKRSAHHRVSGWFLDLRPRSHYVDRTRCCGFGHTVAHQSSRAPRSMTAHRECGRGCVARLQRQRVLVGARTRLDQLELDVVQMKLGLARGLEVDRLQGGVSTWGWGLGSRRTRGALRWGLGVGWCGAAGPFLLYKIVPASGSRKTTGFLCLRGEGGGEVVERGGGGGWIAVDVLYWSH